MALGGVPQGVVDEVMVAGGHRCAECGLEGWRVRQKFSKRWRVSFPTAKPDVYLSIDRIRPRSLGGGQERSNLRVLCTTCNTRRGAAQEQRPTLAVEEHW